MICPSPTIHRGCPPHTKAPWRSQLHLAPPFQGCSQSRGGSLTLFGPNSGLWRSHSKRPHKMIYEDILVFSPEINLSHHWRVVMACVLPSSLTGAFSGAILDLDCTMSR